MDGCTTSWHGCPNHNQLARRALAASPTPADSRSILPRRPTWTVFPVEVSPPPLPPPTPSPKDAHLPFKLVLNQTSPLTPNLALWLDSKPTEIDSNILFKLPAPAPKTNEKYLHLRFTFRMNIERRITE